MINDDARQRRARYQKIFEQLIIDLRAKGLSGPAWTKAVKAVQAELSAIADELGID